MPVYVDNARNPYGRILMCHMVADRIGLARRHFQPGSFPHFDLSLGYRDRALRLGAIPVERRELVGVMRAYRALLLQDEAETGRLREVIAATRGVSGSR